MIQVPEGYVLIKQEDYDALVQKNARLGDLVLKLEQRIKELESRSSLATLRCLFTITVRRELSV